MRSLLMQPQGLLAAMLRVESRTSSTGMVYVEVFMSPTPACVALRSPDISSLFLNTVCTELGC